MARYRGTIQGNRGQASRLGTANSQLVATINGWHIGVSVIIGPDPDNPDRDLLIVRATNGSGYGPEPKTKPMILRGPS